MCDGMFWFVMCCGVLNIDLVLVLEGDDLVLVMVVEVCLDGWRFVIVS